MADNLFREKYRIPSTRAGWHNYDGGDYYVTICTANREDFFGKIVVDVHGENQMVLSPIGEYLDEAINKMEQLHEDVAVPVYCIMPNHIHLIVVINSPNRVSNQMIESTPVETPYYDVSGKNDNHNVETPYYDVSGKNDNHNVETPYYDVSTNESMGDGCETPWYDVSTNESMENGGKNEMMQSIANECGRLSHVISRMKTAVTKFARSKSIPFGWQTRFYDHIIRNQQEKNDIANYISNNVAEYKNDSLCR